MVVLTFFAGIVIASIAMLTGVGGGVLWMPFLLLVADLAPDEAVVAALIIQTCGQGSATWHNLRAGLVDRGLVVQQAKVALPAAVAGAWVSRFLQPTWLRFSLGLLIFVIVYAFLRGDDFFEEGGTKADLEAGERALPVAGVGGLLTGIVGTGLGDWLVPLFNARCRLAMPRAVATAIALMLTLSGLAAMSHLLFGGRAPAGLTAAGAAGVILGAQIGTRLHRRLSTVAIKEIFVLLLLFLAAHVTFNAF